MNFKWPNHRFAHELNFELMNFYFEKKNFKWWTLLEFSAVGRSLVTRPRPAFRLGDVPADRAADSQKANKLPTSATYVRIGVLVQI
jgi:hypothetical protein